MVVKNIKIDGKHKMIVAPLDGDQSAPSKLAKAGKRVKQKRAAPRRKKSKP